MSALRLLRKLLFSFSVVLSIPHEKNNRGGNRRRQHHTRGLSLDKTRGENSLVVKCEGIEPIIVVFNRLPWFRSPELRGTLKNASIQIGWDYIWTSWEKDRYTWQEAMEIGDSLTSHGDALKVAQTIREIQSRATPKPRQRLALMERSFSFLEVPGVSSDKIAWINIVEDPIERSARAFRGSARELDHCVKSMGATKCVPLNSMTQWFCGGGAMCDTKTKRGMAALIRAKLVLKRNYAFVGIREYWDASLKILSKLLPGYFRSGIASNYISLDNGYSRAALLQESTKQAILKANTLDTELYNHALATLDQVYRTCFDQPLLRTRPKLESSLIKKNQQENSAEFTNKSALPQEFYKGSLVNLAHSIAPGNGLAGTCLQRRILHNTLIDDNGTIQRYDRILRENNIICFPSVLGIGASRAGLDIVTTLLATHPSLIVPERPLRYFGQARRRGKRGLFSYARNFPMSIESTRVIGFESSPETYSSRHAITEMKQLLGPQLKIIFALREPSARAYDDFWRYVRAGRLFQRDKELFLCYKETTTSTEESIPSCASRGTPVHARMVSSLVFDVYARQVLLDAWEPALQSTARRALLNDSLPLNFDLGVLNDNIFAKSMYAPQLQRILSAFEYSQIHLIIYENLLSPTRGLATFASLLKFLDLPFKSKHGEEIFFSNNIVYDADAISATVTRLNTAYLARTSANPTTNKDATTMSKGKKESPLYPPLLRKTRRLLEAFFAVDAELMRRMLPNLELPW